MKWINYYSDNSAMVWSQSKPFTNCTDYGGIKILKRQYSQLQNLRVPRVIEYLLCTSFCGISQLIPVITPWNNYGDHPYFAYEEMRPPNGKWHLSKVTLLARGWGTIQTGLSNTTELSLLTSGSNSLSWAALYFTLWQRVRCSTYGIVSYKDLSRRLHLL